MKRLLRSLIGGLALPAAALGAAQAASIRPSSSSRPPIPGRRYNGDYSGRRFSTLTQINDANVKALSLAWIYRRCAGDAGTRSRRRRCMINGVLYFSTPDHA